MDRCQKTIAAEAFGKGSRYQCDLPADHTGMCGFTADCMTAHFCDKRLSDDELIRLSDGRLDPADVKGFNSG